MDIDTTRRTALSLCAIHALLAYVSHRKRRPQPSGVRVENSDRWKGERLVWKLIGEQQTSLYDLTRLKPLMFIDLLNWLTANTALCDSKKDLSAAQKLFIFMYIVAGGVSFRNARHKVGHSLQTISRAFHEVLRALLFLHTKVVLPPSAETPEQIKNNSKRWPFFVDCIGALDGSHIPVSVPTAEGNLASWRNRKGWISQNVLAAVDFHMNFTYVLPGWEGSAHDSRVLSSAVSKGFSVPAGKYYLADSGYSCRSRLVLTPYPRTRYHLKEWKKSASRPKTKQELFNLRHSSLRYVVERTFGVFKERFKILNRQPRGYSLKDQAKMVLALAAVFNFMNQYKDEDSDYDPVQQADELERRGVIGEAGVDNGAQADEVDERDMVARRNEIAELMWVQYQIWE